MSSSPQPSKDGKPQVSPLIDRNYPKPRLKLPPAVWDQ